MFRVSVKKKALKDAEKMPISVPENLAALLENLRRKALSNRVGRITAGSAKKCTIAI